MDRPAATHLRLVEDGPDDFVPLRLILQPSGSAIEVTRPETVIGRHTEADIRLSLPDVSRRHCRLVLADGVWSVIDMNSLNGVRVNGEQVLHARLAQGDTVQVGGFAFAVDLEGADGHIVSILKTLDGSPSRKAG